MSSSSAFVPHTMVISSLDVAQRESRLDPTRYNKRAERILRHLRSQPIGRSLLSALPGVSVAPLAPRFKRRYVESREHGVPFLGSSTMLALHLPEGTLLSRDFRKLPLLMVNPGDILLSRSGTIGVSVLCGESYQGFAVSEHAARIHASEDLRGYIHAWLSTPIGREVVLQQNYGKVIKELTGPQIGNVLVPLADESVCTRVNQLSLSATEAYDAARFALKQADQELREGIAVAGVVPQPGLWINQEHRTFLKSSSSLYRSRLDPHYQKPDIAELRRQFLGIPHEALGAIADLWMPNRFGRPSASKGYGVPFYSSGDIMRARREAGTTVSRRVMRHLARCVVRPGTILVCRSGSYGGILGRAAYVSQAMDGWAVNEHADRCKVTNKEFPSEYVFAFLANEEFGYPLTTALRHGKDVPEISPDELSTIPVPKLTEEKRARIAAHVSEAFKRLDLANALEDQAQAELLSALKWDEDAPVVKESLAPDDAKD